MEELAGWREFSGADLGNTVDFLFPLCSWQQPFLVSQARLGRGDRMRQLGAPLSLAERRWAAVPFGGPPCLGWGPSAPSLVPVYIAGDHRVGGAYMLHENPVFLHSYPFSTIISSSSTTTSSASTRST
jgi:hypothetical protein